MDRTVPTETTGSGVTTFLNPFEAGFFDDPYRQYAALREYAPVHQSPLGPWMLTRYDDCVRVVRDPRVSVDERKGGLDRRALMFGPDDPRRRRGVTAILNSDPPDHTRIRRLVGKAFTPRRIDALGPRIEAIVDEMLDAAADAGAMDVIADLAFPLPFVVISELLGMPETDRDRLRDVSHTLVRTLEPLTTPDELPELREASDAMAAHVDAAIAWKRRNPGDDLLSALVDESEGPTVTRRASRRAESDPNLPSGDGLSPDELHDQVALLYIAGHETTVNLIGNGVVALLRHPDQLARLRGDPALINNAVEELLRYYAPVQFSRRILLDTIEIDGHAISAHSFVLLALGAANRDPAHFGPDADRLDITRVLASQHLAFGGGIHHCLGAALARAEARAAIAALVQRFPNLALATDTPAWNGRLVLRGLDSLPVRLR